MIRWVRVGVFEEMTFEWKARGVTDRGGGYLVIGNDGGGGKEMVRSSGGRSFQKRGALMDMAPLENMRLEVTGGRERVIQDDDRVERVGWMVKSSRRYVETEGTRRYTEEGTRRRYTM